MQIGQLVVAVVVLLVLDKMQLLLPQVKVKVEMVVMMVPVVQVAVVVQVDLVEVELLIKVMLVEQDQDQVLEAVVELDKLETLMAQVVMV